MQNKTTLQRRIRFLLVFFMCALAVSGLTAIPLQWELGLLMPMITRAAQWGIHFPAFSQWIERINDAVQNGYGQYPFLAYGTDWLAFGHVAIALAFLGPLRDPVKNSSHRNCDKIHRIKDVRQLTPSGASANFVSALENL